MDTSGLSEDDLDEYEFSEDEAKHTNNHKKLLDKQYDEVYEVSQDLSVAESFSAPQVEWIIFLINLNHLPLTLCLLETSIWKRTTI